MRKVIKEVYRRFEGKSYIFCLESKLIGNRRILDLGCGRGSPIRFLPKNFYSVGVEFFKPYLLMSKEKQIHDDYIQSDIRKLGFRSKSFDVVMALDVLEHLTKVDGLNLIKNMEEIAKETVVIFTPNGFIHQLEHNGNVFQVHQSGWAVREFREMGYEVKGINGLKFLRKEEAHIRFRPRKLFGIIADVSQRFTYHFPNLAYQLLCVKKLHNEQAIDEKASHK
jgi:SAM-dependent methyltransferase